MTRLHQETTEEHHTKVVGFEGLNEGTATARTSMRRFDKIGK